MCESTERLGCSSVAQRQDGGTLRRLREPAKGAEVLEPLDLGNKLSIVGAERAEI